MSVNPPIIPEKDLKLQIHLVNKHEDKEFNDTSLRKYKNEFLYAKIDKDKFDYTFKTNQTFKEVKEIVANLTNFSPKMMSLAKWSSYDEKENMDYYTRVNYNDNDTLYNSCFNQPYTETKYLYIIIDKDKFESHQMLNNIFEDNNKKIEEYNIKSQNLENENKSLKIQIDTINNNMREKIQDMNTSHRNEIRKLKDENLRTEENLRRTKKEFEVYSNREKERHKIEQEKLMGKIKSIEDQRKMEKEAEQRNEAEAEFEFEKQVQEIKNNFYKEFETNLIFEIKKFCFTLKETKNEVDLLSNRLVKLFHKNYELFSSKLFDLSKQNFSLKTEEIYTTKIANFLDDQFKDINHINTIAIGRAGVGKSTLINNILKIKGTDKEAKTGIGKSVTNDTKLYNSEKVPFLRVYDTPGLDFKLSIKELFNNIKSIVENKLNSNNPDEFINCIWYCVTGKRFQDDERDFIKEIMRLYSSSYLPIIIVFLQMGEDDTNLMKEETLNIFKESKEEEHLLKQTKFCRVISEDICDKKKVIYEATGFNELLNLTKKEIKNSVESALYENIKKRIKTASFEFTGVINKSIDEVFEDDMAYLSKQKKLLEKKILKEEDNIEERENSDENINAEEDIDIMEETEYEKNNYYENFTLFMSQKLEEVNQIIKNNYSPTRQTTIFKKKIQENLQLFIKLLKNWESFNKFYEKIITKESRVLSKRIIEKQNEIDFKKKSRISQKGYQWDKICKEEIDSKYRIIAYLELYKNAFAILSQGCLINFKKNVNELFDEIINKKENKDLLLNKAKKCMNNLIEDIKIEFEEEKKKVIKNNKKDKKDKKEQKKNNNKNKNEKNNEEEKEDVDDIKSNEEEEEEEEEQKSEEAVNDYNL